MAIEPRETKYNSMNVTIRMGRVSRKCPLIKAMGEIPEMALLTDHKICL